MMFLIPIGIAVLGTGSTALYRRVRRGTMTPERKKIYESALTSLKDPEKLRKLADSFASLGLKSQSELLHKRAKLRELPDTTKKARRAIFKKGLRSKNREAVLSLAATYHQEGATGAAAALRLHAESLGKSGLDSVSVDEDIGEDDDPSTGPSSDTPGRVRGKRRSRRGRGRGKNPPLEQDET